MALGEFQMIDRLLKPLARGCPGALGLADDAALLDPTPGQQLVIAKDAIVENVHFLAADPPDSVSRKLLRQNLSDLAAMGADPSGYLLAIGRRTDLAEEWLAGFVEGLAADQAEFGIHLMGGDTVATSGPLFFSLTILGIVPDGQALTRAGAEAGDLICVSGTLGDGALGLRVLKGELSCSPEAAAYLSERYRVPAPRLELGRQLRGLATACMDVSDGLLGDLHHILTTSSAAQHLALGATIHSAQIPMSRAASGLPEALYAALSGGDDYELLFTLPEHLRPALAALPSPVTVIGEIQTGSDIIVCDETGAPMPIQPASWTHF